MPEDTAGGGSTAAGVAFQRSKGYRLLSYGFSFPEEGVREFLSSPVFADELRSSAKDHPCWAGGPLDRLRPPVPDEDLATEYVALLTLESRCPPYENEYHRDDQAFFTTEPMADVAGFYRAFGMGFAQERPDHVAAELEFMHLATLREAEAEHRGDAEAAALCVSIERKFLEEHLGRWVSGFRRGLATEGSRFYLTVGEVLEEWVAAECRHLAVSPQPLGDPRPDRRADEGHCPAGGEDP